ncbi:MAG: hypothetical protein KA250_13570 [Verrucomicrobiales bacterium]|nr:hypothetical protein [Verrucomicrobiales bacterium]
MTLVLSIFAIVISLVAIAIQFLVHWRQHRQSALATNLASLAELQLMIASYPELLRFHSVTPEELQEHGLSATDFAYLLANLHTGSIYYSTVDVIPSESPFTESDPYRYYMMKSPEMRKAWPLLQRFLNESSYKTRLRLTALGFDVTNQRAEQGADGNPH